MMCVYPVVFPEQYVKYIFSTLYLTILYEFASVFNCFARSSLCSLTLNAPLTISKQTQCKKAMGCRPDLDSLNPIPLLVASVRIWTLIV